MHIWSVFTNIGFQKTFFSIQKYFGKKEFGLCKTAAL